MENPHDLFESEYRQQYRSLPFWKRSIILVAGVAMNLLFAILLFIVWLCVIGMDVQTAAGEIVHVNLNPLQAIQFGFMYIGAVSYTHLDVYTRQGLYWGCLQVRPTRLRQPARLRPPGRRSGRLPAETFSKICGGTP